MSEQNHTSSGQAFASQLEPEFIAVSEEIVPAIEFTNFLKLSKELQINIWQFACLESHTQMLILLMQSHEAKVEYPFRKRFDRKLRKYNVHASAGPGVLLACYLSREIALEYYQRVEFRNFNYINEVIDGGIYINRYVRDRMYIDASMCVRDQRADSLPNTFPDEQVALDRIGDLEREGRFFEALFYVDEETMAMKEAYLFPSDIAQALEVFSMGFNRLGEILCLGEILGADQWDIGLGPFGVKIEAKRDERIALGLRLLSYHSSSDMIEDFSA